MAVPIRETTRQAWEALRAAGDVPSVRKVYAQVGGAYNVVVAECQALRAATDDQPHPAPRVLPQGVCEALWALYDAVQQDRTFAHNFRVRLSLLQGSSDGPLTRVLDAIQHKEG